METHFAVSIDILMFVHSNASFTLLFMKMKREIIKREGVL
jgi:hypothetical protein